MHGVFNTNLEAYKPETNDERRADFPLFTSRIAGVVRYVYRGNNACITRSDIRPL